MEKLYVQGAPSDGDYLSGRWTQGSVSAAPSTDWMFAETLGDRLVVGGKNNA